MVKSKHADLIFHVGFGKTGISFLQKNIQLVDDILYIGKFNDSVNKVKFLDILNSTHKNLFRSVRGEVVKGFSNPSRSSSYLVKEYSEKLVQIIISSEKNTVVISDECIGDYVNFIGEWNLCLIIAIGNQVEEYLIKKKWSINKKISFTIRNQVEIVTSFYGYSRQLREKDINQFISNSLKDPYRGYFGGLYYHSNIKMFESIAGPSWKIFVVPYEILSIDNDINKYCSHVLGISKPSDFIVAQNVSHVNSNSTISNGKRTVKLRDRNFLTKLSFRLCQENHYAYQEARRRELVMSKIYFGILFMLGRVLEKIDNLGSKIIPSRYFRQKFVNPSVASILKIKKNYSSDNKQLVNYLTKIDLHRFGYLD